MASQRAKTDSRPGAAKTKTEAARLAGVKGPLSAEESAENEPAHNNLPDFLPSCPSPSPKAFNGEDRRDWACADHGIERQHDQHKPTAIINHIN